MINHNVIIGGSNVDNYVVSVKASCEVDGGSPGTCSVTLANPHSIWVGKFVPQKDYMSVVLFNGDTPYSLFYGSIADVKSDAISGTIEINGECDVGHLLDALDRDYSAPLDSGNMCKPILNQIVSDHKPPIVLMIDDELQDVPFKGVDITSKTTYAQVIYDIANLLGAVVYTDETGVVQLRSYKHLTDFIDVTNECTNPQVAQSLTAYCNYVTVNGYSSLDPTDAYTTPSGETFTATAVDQESIDKYGKIAAPIEFRPNLHTQEDVQKAADDLRDRYAMQKDTLTEVSIQGKIPLIQSIIKFNQFMEPRDSAVPEWYGYVMKREVRYSSNDGLAVSVQVHPYPNQAAAQAEINAMTVVETPVAEPTTDGTISNSDNNYVPTDPAVTQQQKDFENYYNGIYVETYNWGAAEWNAFGNWVRGK